MGLFADIKSVLTRPIVIGRSSAPRALGGRTSAAMPGLTERAIDDEMGRILERIVGMVKRSEPPVRGTAELLVAYNRSPHVRSVVGKIAQLTAMVPWFAEVKQGNKWVPSETHALAELWNNPNPHMSRIELMKLVNIHLDLVGESFIAIERKANGEPAELWPIPPTWVKSTPDAEGECFEVESRAKNNGGLRVDVQRRDMIWIRDLNPDNPYTRGAGTGMALGDELDTDEFTAKHLKSWFLNKAVPAYLMTLENASIEETKAAKEVWDEKNRGPMANNRTHWLNAAVKATRLDDKFADMQLVDLRKFAAAIVRETYGIPPEIVGHIDSSNRSTIDAALYIASQMVVLPRLILIRESANRVLSPQFKGAPVRLMNADPAPASASFKLEVMKAQATAFKINDFRRLAGETENKDGDVYVMNTAVFAPVTSLNPQAFAKESAETAATIAGASAGAVEAATEDPAKAAEAVKSTAKKVTARATRTRAADEPAPKPTAAQIKAALAKNPTERAAAPGMRRAVRTAGERSVKENNLPTAFDPVSATANYIRNSPSIARVRGVDETTLDHLLQQLSDGYDEGEGIDDLKRRIRDTFGYGVDVTADEARAISARARTIARTETLGPANFARLESYRQQAPGLVKGKGWLAIVGDGRAREDHIAMNGVIVPLDQDFVVGDDEMDGPGQGSEADQNINCRCTTIPVVVDDEDDAEKAFKAVRVSAIMQWRSFQRDVAYLQVQMTHDVNRNLKAQMQSIFDLIE